MALKPLVLFTTHTLEPEVLARFDAMDVPAGFEKRLFVHSHSLWPWISRLKLQAGDRPLETFNLGEARWRGYRPLRRTLLPGSNHLPVIARMQREDVAEFDAVWVVEYDVHYAGDWSDIFTSLNDVPSPVDFCSTHLELPEDKPGWIWWTEGLFFSGSRTPRFADEKTPLIKSFNPLYRLSRRALTLLDEDLRRGWRGHHEVLLATRLAAHGLRIEELGGEGRWTPAERRGKFYHARETYRWRPAVDASEANQPGTLYHPVKLPSEVAATKLAV